MIYLVTGANGYLGRGIVKKLLDDGHTVIGIDFSTKELDTRAIHVEKDLFEINNFDDFSHQPDVLIHLAWRNGFVHNSDSHLEDLAKHKKFIENMLKAGIKNIVVMGSMHEVGFFEGSIREETPCEPQSLYGIAKNSLRQATMLLVKQYGARLQWLRGFYIVSNESYGNSIFSKIVQAVEKGQKQFPFTMGLNQFDFIDYEDFCQQVAAVAQQSDINGIINICSGYPEKLADRVQRFLNENEYDIELQYGAFPDRSYDSKAIWGDNRNIKKVMKNYYERKN